MTAAQIKRSFTGAIGLLSVITDFNFIHFNNNEWVTVLSAHPRISLPWWWDNHKMRAKKNVAKVEDVRYLRPLLRIKTNVNSACDVNNLDQIGPISVQDVQPSWFSWTTSADPSLTLVLHIMTWTWFKSTINVEPGSAEPRFDRRWWNAPSDSIFVCCIFCSTVCSCYLAILAIMK